MSDEAMTTDEERRRLAERPEPVPEADALEQTEEVEPNDDDEVPSIPPEVPEADALDQARAARRDDTNLAKVSFPLGSR